jgi:iron complex outermembrane receptor protein
VVLPQLFDPPLPPGTPDDPSCPIVCEDWNQSQYLDVETFSQEVRYTSSADERLRWIVGAYLTTTDRFISTGNMVDRGNGVFPVYRSPSTNPLNPQVTYLADGQDNTAWAVFGDLSYDISDDLEFSFSLRYDEDKREQTTLTPEAFLPNVPGFPQGFTGEVRTHTWDELQPKVSLRYRASDNLTVYGDYSKGFRSGGFNQTGVGPLAAASGFIGVGDLFDAEVAETLEFGLKGQFANGRVNANLAVYDTESKGPYFFIFIVTNSTQNLGNIDKVDYRGFEFDVTAAVTDYLDLFLGYGSTDSEIKEFGDPSVIGNKAPLVSDNTVNAGAQYRRPLGSSNLELSLRADYERIGDTYWEPYNTTVRNPVNLLDLRIGLHGENWSLVGWERNVNDVHYNAEFSPGGFVFKAKPQRWGVDFTKNF